MRFADWPILLLLLLIPLLHRWLLARNRPARAVFPLPVERKAAVASPVKALLLLKYLGWALLIVALARPQTSFRQTERTVSGVDILMVLDLSASMNIEDLGERSRFEIAQETMENFIKGRQNDRIGFVVFSGEPLTLAPPTLDYGLVLKALRDSKIGVLRDGTAIGDGLSLAVSHLRNSKAKSRVVVLLTDGDNNVGQVDPGTAGELAAGYGIRVYTIAIGREGKVKMPIRQQSPFGNPITTYQWFDNALNPELLQGIAKATGGRFYRVTDESTLGSVFREIDQLERTEIKATEKVRYEENFQRPLKLGLLLLLLELLLARGWWRVLP
ncbi:MAG: VWA domain-containing protein [Oligoflexia bacterium]|nr:VWA domain-containing protein [Oligoflexia bacterium]